MTKHTWACLSIIVVAGSCSDPTALPDGDDLDLETAKLRAAELGTFLGPLVVTIAETVESNVFEDAVVQGVWTEFLGAEVSAENTSSGRLFDASFELGPAAKNRPDTAVSTDGRPILTIDSLSGYGGFFYELTVLDTRTGALYQGFSNTASVPIAEWSFFGPLVPPDNARITGHFDNAGLGQLAAEIRAALTDYLFALCEAQDSRCWL